MILGSFFKYFGGKHRNWRLYPSPKYDTIVEPFCGSAAYSCKYSDKNVILIDCNPIVIRLWQWLINVSIEELLAMPVPAMGQDFREFQWPSDEALLLAKCCSTSWGAVTNLDREGVFHSPVAADGGDFGRFYGQAWKEKLIRQVPYIRHWRAYCCSYTDFDYPKEPCSYFVDPPYQDQADGRKLQLYKNQIPFDHYELGKWCQSRNGQVIACDGSNADWLPFHPLQSGLFGAIEQATGSSHRVCGGSKKSKQPAYVEGIWTQIKEVL